MTISNKVNDYTQFIYLASNKTLTTNGTNKNGTKLVMKTLIPQPNNTLVIDEKKLDNKIIISGIINPIHINSSSSSVDPVLLLTKHNLNNNINFCYKNNDFNNPRILFLKYNSSNDICNNFIFTLDNSNIIINNHKLPNILYNQYYPNNKIDSANIIRENDNDRDKLTFIQYYMNIYKNYQNSDYYNIKFSDFINLIDLSGTTNISNINYSSYNNLKFIIKNKSIINEFSNNLINYNPDYFTNIFYKSSDNNFYNIDSSLNNIIDFSNDNIFLYNKLSNLTSLNLTYEFNNNYITNYSISFDLYNDICINFIVLKNKDVTNNYGKIYLNKDYNYFNCFVTNNNSNFYDNSYNSKFTNLYDNSGIIFLSLGNGITGFTQKNLSNIKFDLTINQTTNQLGSITNKDYININKINFSSSLTNTQQISTNNYFADSNYNYDYTNITYIYVKEQDSKLFNLNISNINYFYNTDFSNNLYYSKYINDALRNNNVQDFYNNYNSSNDNYSINNIEYDNTKYRFNVNNYNNSYNTNLSLQNYPILDFRYNHSKQFDTSFTVNLFYDNSSNLVNNFFKILVNNYVETTEASDFTNVNCIFIYHDPIKTRDPSFLYPNNNIEIIIDHTFDTFEKVIVNLPELATSTTNYTFIPAKNGSNLSRKHIEGLIGLNNIPKLLSIKPYDPNFINGRGFISQYEINDACISDKQRVINKINLSKKNQVKNTNNTHHIKKLNFANIVRSRRNKNIPLNKLITELSCNNIVNYPSSQNYYTPFKLFKSGRGTYLGPK